MPTVLGSNSKDHRFLLTIGGVDWGEFEDVDEPSIKIDGEERFVQPGDNFESSGGGNYQFDAVSATRHWKKGRDSPLVKQFVTAVANRSSLTGTGGWYEVNADGTLAAAPWLAIEVIVTEATGSKVTTKSGAGEFKVSLNPLGAPVMA